jgi:hypothetical protein
MCYSASASGHVCLAAWKLLVPFFAWVPCMNAPHASLLASVEIVRSHTTVRVGGPHFLPTSHGSRSSQNYSSTRIATADNFTVTPHPQPGLEFRSLYSTTSCCLPLGMAGVVDCRYPTTLASWRFWMHCF